MSLVVFILVPSLLLAVAFVLVARRCGTEERAVAITAWLAAAAALLGLVSLFLGISHRLSPVPISLALIAFGIAAHRRFGRSWSVPASLAGLFGLLGVVSPFVLTVVWLIPLFVLGIAMCRTRVH
jgi:hypothetical protein